MRLANISRTRWYHFQYSESSLPNSACGTFLNFISTVHLWGKRTEQNVRKNWNGILSAVTFDSAVRLKNISKDHKRPNHMFITLSFAVIGCSLTVSFHAVVDCGVKRPQMKCPVVGSISCKLRLKMPSSFMFIHQLQRLCHHHFHRDRVWSCLTHTKSAMLNIFRLSLTTKVFLISWEQQWNMNPAKYTRNLNPLSAGTVGTVNVKIWVNRESEATGQKLVERLEQTCLSVTCWQLCLIVMEIKYSAVYSLLASASCASLGLHSQ